MESFGFVVDVAFVLAVVAFFKAQFALKGLAPIGAAFAVAAFVVFLPDLVALVPGSSDVVQRVADLLKVFLAAPGLFDLAVNLKSK